MKNLKEKTFGAAGSISGIASIFGSWQVCHSICLGIIALLSIVGITITGMPLFFLTKVAVPFWIAAFVLLVITILIYTRKKCISRNLILFNSGLIIAGVPFQPLQKFSIFFWIVGGLIALTGVFLFVKDKFRHKKCRHEKPQSDFLLYALLAVIVLGLVFALGGLFISMPDSSDVEEPVVKEFKAISSGSTEPGDVSMELTPLGIKDGRLQVSIVANTHSVDLSQFDLKEIAELESAGKKTKPVSAPVLSGHHASGLLEFDIDNPVKSFVIRIVGIPKVEERIFEWD